MTAAMATKRQILIVDDHPIVRQGLRRMFEAEADLAVCGEADSEPAAREAIRARKPDIVVVDLSLERGDGIELVRQMHAEMPELRMLVLSMHDETIYAERLLAAGAMGYIMKQAASDQLLIAVRRVLDGRTYVSETVQRSLDQRAGESRSETNDPVVPPFEPGSADPQHDRPRHELARDRAGIHAVREDHRIPPPDHQAQARTGHEQPAAAVRHEVVQRRYPAQLRRCRVGKPG